MIEESDAGGATRGPHSIQSQEMSHQEIKREGGYAAKSSRSLVIDYSQPVLSHMRMVDLVCFEASPSFAGYLPFE